MPQSARRRDAARKPTTKTDKIIADYRDAVADVEDAIRKLDRTADNRLSLAKSSDQQCNTMEAQCVREHRMALRSAMPKV